MPPTKNLNAYGTHERVLETALVAGGAKLELETYSQAFVWQRDANYFRKLLRDRSTDGRCKYDVIKITVRGPVVFLENRVETPIKGLTSLAGRPLDAVVIEKPKPLTPEEKLRLAEQELNLDDGG
jgi:hypothetical protein